MRAEADFAKGLLLSSRHYLGAGRVGYYSHVHPAHAAIALVTHGTRRRASPHATVCGALAVLWAHVTSTASACARAVGVGGTASLAIHEFCKQIAMAENGLRPRVIRHGNLNSSRDMTDASDSAPVVIQLAERGNPGEAYNVGSGRTTSVAELLRIAISFARVQVMRETASIRELDPSCSKATPPCSKQLQPVAIATPACSPYPRFHSLQHAPTACSTYL